MELKDVHLIIYYADTRAPLSFRERMDMHELARVVSITPREVLLRDRSGRLVIVTRAGLPGTPPVPEPNDPRQHP